MPMTFLTSAFAAIALAQVAGLAVAARAEPLALQVSMPPTPVNAGGARRLAYELELTNVSADTLEIARVRALDAGANTAIVDLAGDALDAAYVSADAARAEHAGPQRLLAPGARAIVYIDAVLPAGAATPSALRHAVGFYLARPGAAHVQRQSEGAPIDVGRNAPVVLAPPLRGGPWAAVYDPSTARGHRRVYVMVRGRARIPARFAIDWIKLDADGRYAHGDAAQVANWYGYAADVLAVAAGVIVEVRDGRPESAETSAPRSNTLENASGNYIVLDVGGGRYAIYEHLKPGSVRVKAGQRVAAGEVIGALGYTGDSTGPHLHFHVADAPDPLAAEGLPYVFAHYDLLGAYASIQDFGKGGRWPPRDAAIAKRRDNELPGANAVVEFAGAGTRSP